MKDELMRMERITCIEDGVYLLQNFNINIYRGEILGLLYIDNIGLENFLELLVENKPIHFGRVYFQELLVNNHLHSDYSRNKVVVIEKQSGLVGHLTVADNVFVLREGFRKHIIYTHRFTVEFQALCEGLNVSIDADEYADRLTGFERCVVEIIRAVATGVQLIVIRDVSNFISAVDLERLHDIIQFYKARGISFIYVCNHHEEIFGICDRTAMMGNGRIIRLLNKKDMNALSMQPYIKTMIAMNEQHAGKELEEAEDKIRQPVLEFNSVTTESMQNMRLKVSPGECVVLLDINNTTQEDFLQLLSGQIRPLKGEILLENDALKKASQRRRIALIKEKPTQSMLFSDISYLDNLCFLVDQRVKRVWVSHRIRKSIIKQFLPLVGEDIYKPDLKNLSAKSLYTLVYSRVDFQHPLVTVCIQPFSGADFYLRLHIIQLIRRLLDRGTAVVIWAVSFSDSLQLADRLLVIKEGRICMEYSKAEIAELEKNNKGIREAFEPDRNTQDI